MKTKLILSLLFVILGIYFNNVKAQTWSALGSGLEYGVTTFTIYNGYLYAGGDGVYQWDGNSWNGMNEGLSSFGGGAINTLAVSNGGNLYYGGADFFVLCPDLNLYNYAGRWNGSKWITVGSGTGNDGSGMDGYVSVMASYNGQLIAGGNFGSAGGDPLYPLEVYYTASFAGTSCCWSAMGSGMNDYVRELTVDSINNVLYAADYFTEAGGVSANHIAKWDGSAWSALGTGTDGKITALCMHNGELYAGGLFTTAGGNSATNVAKWNGSSWSVSGLDVDDFVEKLFVFNNELYVGGAFLNAGGNPARHVAKFSVTTGILENTINNNINIYPNPTTGKFTIENKGDLTICNLLGKNILSQKLTSAKTEIDLSNHPKGIYFAKIRDRGNNCTVKILIQ